MKRMLPVKFPVIEMLGLREFGVSQMQDCAEARVKAKLDGFVQEEIGVVRRRAIAAAYQQKQRFVVLASEIKKGMVAVLAVIGEIHSLLALGVARDNRPIGVQNRFFRRTRAVAQPRRAPAGFIDRVHQGHDIHPTKSAAEVARSRGIGDALCSQGVEIDFVVPPQFEVFEPLTACQDVESDVQDVVRLVIRGDAP